MCKQYGYCRISTRKQSIDRQIRNIQTVYPNAIIIKEVFTGTKFQGRKELDKVLAKVTIGDIIIFDSVSRMSRNADEGIALYMELYDKGVNLVFLKEPHINTETYKSALSNEIQLTGGDVDDILIGVNSYLKKLATKQIRIAFEQSEKEVEDLHQRTKEGMETARLNGKQIGHVKGVKLTTKKSISAKKVIKEHAIDFGGTLKDVDVIRLTGLSRNTYYKYKRELIAELD